MTAAGDDGAPGSTDPDDGASVRPIESANWDARLLRDGRNRIEPSLANAYQLFKFHPQWCRVLGFDTFRQRVVCLQPPPFERTDDGPLTDTDYHRARLWMGDTDKIRCNFSATDIAHAIDLVARETRFHAVAKYLDEAEATRNDSPLPRLDTVFTRFFGAKDDPFARAAGRRWLIAAVARARRPGCQMDTMIVLEDQKGGLGKSSGFRALAGDDWYTDHLGDFEARPADVANQLDGVWIVELPEMNAIRRAKSSDAIKEFLSRREERHVHKWERETRTVPRTCVFAGTTQTNDYLRGGDGGEARRFHPIEIERPVDVDGIGAYRTAIWGEAAAAHRAGEPWWFAAGGTGEAETRIRSAGRSEDALTGVVRTALAGHELHGIRLEEVMTAVYGGGEERPDGSRTSVRGWGSDREEKRVIKALRMLGWHRVQVTIPGGGRPWVYKPQK